MTTESSLVKSSAAHNSKNSDEINRPLCAICHDRSSGFHYGTHACEGCKGFFRRMVTNVILIQSMLQCTGNDKDNCDINIVTRNNCQRCRLQKCFQMGMTRHKTRLGRRTKASAIKLEGITLKFHSTIILNDDEMMKYIKRESHYFNNNDTEDDEPLAKCIKHKAKLYSEKNSKCYHKYLNNIIHGPGISLGREVIPKLSSIGIASSTKVTTSGSLFDRQVLLKCCSSEAMKEISNYGNDKNIFGMSDLDIGDSKAMDFTQNFLNSLSPISNVTISSYGTSEGSSLGNNLNVTNTKHGSYYNAFNYCKRSPMFESIRINTEKLQIDKMFLKIRIFLTDDFDKDDFLLLNYYKKIISALNSQFFNPNTKEVDKFCRSKLSSIKYSSDPQMVFAELKCEMIEMCTNIMDFFRRLLDLELFQRLISENELIKKKIIQTLAIWMIRFVNVSENILYNPKLSMKIPFQILSQSPLGHFFEILFNLADIASSILTTEIDDTELSFISVLIVTFPKKGFIHCSENMLQSDNFLKIRFLYSTLLYEYMLTEKFHQDIDNTENRFQKFCWLINQSHLLQEREVNYLFNYLKL